MNDSEPLTASWEFSLRAHCLGQVYVPSKEFVSFDRKCSVFCSLQGFLLLLLPLLFLTCLPTTPFLKKKKKNKKQLQIGHLVHKCSLSQPDVGLAGFPVCKGRREEKKRTPCIPGETERVPPTQKTRSGQDVYCLWQAPLTPHSTHALHTQSWTKPLLSGMEATILIWLLNPWMWLVWIETHHRYKMHATPGRLA